LKIDLILPVIVNLCVLCALRVFVFNPAELEAYLKL